MGKYRQGRDISKPTRTNETSDGFTSPERNPSQQWAQSKQGEGEERLATT
jgi:hypothetical protein